MKWLIVAAVVVVLLAVAWWSSGRARPMSDRRREMSRTEKSAHQSHAQRNSHHNGAGGFSI